MDAQRKGIFKNAIGLSWYMRGGLQFTDIMNMSHEEIEYINGVIEGNMETTKKTNLPFF